MREYAFMMGLTAIVSSSASATSTSATTSATSLLSPVGAGIGGIFVFAALILALAYFDVFDAADRLSDGARYTVLPVITSLSLVATAIVTFHSLQVI